MSKTHHGPSGDMSHSRCWGFVRALAPWLFVRLCSLCCWRKLSMTFVRTSLRVSLSSGRVGSERLMKGSMARSIRLVKSLKQQQHLLYVDEYSTNDGGRRLRPCIEEALSYSSRTYDVTGVLVVDGMIRCTQR